MSCIPAFGFGFLVFSAEALYSMPAGLCRSYLLTCSPAAVQKVLETEQTANISVKNCSVRMVLMGFVYSFAVHTALGAQQTANTPGTGLVCLSPEHG